MANGVKDQFAYVLADVTGMDLTTATTDPALRGEGRITLDVFGLKVPFTQKVVSSIANNDNHMLLVRLSGNLLMLATAFKLPGDLKLKARVTLVNLAKLGSSTKWLELNCPRTHDEAVKMMGKAAVATFARISINEWERLTEAA